MTPMAGSAVGACRSNPSKRSRCNLNFDPREGPILDRYLMVMLGGATGSLARYLLGAAIMNRVGSRFPLGTVVINITGSFLIGFLMTMLTERLSPHPLLRPLLVVGFLGGYTTFSSFEW